MYISLHRKEIVLFTVPAALPHHDAAHGDQRRRGEAEALSAEQRRDDHVAPRAQLAVGLQRHAAPEAVEHQRLVRLRQADLPGRARVLDARPPEAKTGDFRLFPLKTPSKPPLSAETNSSSPSKTAVFATSQALAGARTAVAAANQDVVRLALRHPGGHHAHADLAHQLHRDARVRVRVLQIEDELRQVLAAATWGSFCNEIYVDLGSMTEVRYEIR